jgi:gamma-glutamyltranspeptidase/glutathione hydrolase
MTATQTDPQCGPWSVSGRNGGVTCSTPEAALAGLEVLREGGSATDAFIAAAFVQTVLENGSTTVAGAFFLQLYQPGTAAVECVHGVYGPAADEDYEGYDGWTEDRRSGRGIPAPGFVAGAWQAHQEFGRLPWTRLLAPAVRHARDGFTLGELWRTAYIQASPDALRHVAAQRIWTDAGVLRAPGSVIYQPELADTLNEIADGPEAHFTGRFAAEYVGAARAQGGRLQLADLARWRERIQRSSARLDIRFGDVQMASQGSEVAAFAHCVAHMLDIRSHGANSAAALDISIRAWGRGLRLVKEMPLSRILDPEVIQREAYSLLSRPRESLHLRAAFGTNGVVAVDAQGTVAYGVHTINCPSSFGVGGVVGGAYVGYAINRRHAVEGKVTAEGVGAAELVVRNGQALAAGASPGFSCFLTPWQFVTNLVEFGMDAARAAYAARFGVASPVSDNRVPVESSVGSEALQGLEAMGCPHQAVPMGPGQGGLLSGLYRSPDGLNSLVQDPRREGVATAW